MISNNKILIGVAASLLLIGAVVVFGFEYSKVNDAENGDGKIIACTMEAKLCPDGSYVGRIGPKCEFAPCPSISFVPTNSPSPIPSKLPRGTLTGEVTLSPICPVERMPPDPNCVPKPYVTDISIISQNTNKIVTTTKTNEQGRFTLEISPGAYIVRAKGGTTLPRCGDQNVTVKANTTTSVQISCDTGIR